ncbi:DUF2043 domain-containing protein [Leptospira kemamanensis]|uniref:DUF2043 domain-containing protein n=1 Tax=Leptospira kemamanensis TaxID=2484942 RepID=A0A4R9JRG2_9LEPT|nr:DUF2043 domain-containing protein [Leptospira kemamanensis]
MHSPCHEPNQLSTYSSFQNQSRNKRNHGSVCQRRGRNFCRKHGSCVQRQTTHLPSV